jgi:hypothetical protein
VQPGPVCTSMNPGPMDHNGNQARDALHDVARLQKRWRCVARCTAIANPVAVCCTM